MVRVNIEFPPIPHRFAFSEPLALQLPIRQIIGDVDDEEFDYN